MLENLPFYIPVVFIACVIFVYFLFLKASKYAPTVAGLMALFILVQGALGYMLFYTVTTVIPPRFPLLFLPAFVLMAYLFLSKKGKDWIDGIDLKTITILHIVRIPVEIVLYWLFLEKTIPELMTFAGRNFDILAGITAPIIFYLVFIKSFSKKYLAWWNILSLMLLVNIIINALLSVPLPFQQFAFDQPNIAILHFPFVLLPGFIVPLVLFCHFVAIKRNWKYL